MERSAAYIIVVDYIENHILPSLTSEVTRCVAGGCLVAVPKILDMLVSKHEAVLRFLDILDENGDVNLNGVEKWLNNAFRVQPELVVKVDEVIGTLFPACPPLWLEFAKVTIKFKKKDADELVASLSRA